ncbi:MAG: hypothetical protein KatS3mg012_0715 [Gaiellaceae bacterium]|nr:MAG: hypothetical protein KatS3mg012_0715 [Gaiellaceae bacterium]
MAETTIRPPKQKRSHASLERVLTASKSLLEERGFDGFTIQDASQRAGVSVGAIYARFGSKVGLLRAVHMDTMASIEARHEELAAEERDAANAREAVVAAVRRVADIFREREDLLRAFMHLGAVDEAIAKRGSESSIDLAHRFAAAVLEHRGEIRHPDPEKAVDVAYRMAYCTFARQVMYGPTFESDRPIPWDDLVSEIGNACAAYLLSEPGSQA